jgi:hypothetical protein
MIGTPQTSEGPTYPAYDSLWHLVTMGVLTADHQPNGWAPEPACTRPSRVVLIDTSVAVDHPNLAGVINRDLALDLFSARLGSFPGLAATAVLGDLGLGDSAAVTAGLPHSASLLGALTARLSPGNPARYKGIAPATSPVFSSHGTAMVGLIGARPAVIDADPSFVPTEDGKLTLPYCGVDPLCEVVPISTNFDTDPEALILAFLYADLIRADVIVLPRVIPDPMRTVPELTSYVVDEDANRPLIDAIAPYAITATEREQWDELLELIARISLRRPVVCAAGNANEEYGVYPANFASDDNGIIAVGAVNAKGWNCSYSPTRNLTVWAPSTDAERLDRGEVRQDVRRHDYDTETTPVPNNNDRYSYFDLIATDVPGTGGYAISPFPGPNPPPESPMREFGSYYCRFGGTSGASAIIGGFLSLGHSTGSLPQGCGGIEAKAWLLSKSVSVGPDNGTMVMPVFAGTPSFPDQSR